MGCMHSGDAINLDMDFYSEKQSKIKEFAELPGGEDIQNPLELDEGALLDDATTVIKFSTQRNDIQPMSKENILKIANQISRHAPEKLANLSQEKNQQKVVLNAKFIQNAIEAES